MSYSLHFLKSGCPFIVLLDALFPHLLLADVCRYPYQLIRNGFRNMPGKITVGGQQSLIAPPSKQDAELQAKGVQRFRVAGRLRLMTPFSPSMSKPGKAVKQNVDKLSTQHLGKKIGLRRSNALRYSRLPSIHKRSAPGSINTAARPFQKAVSQIAEKFASKGTVPKELITTQRNAIEKVTIGGDEIFGSFGSVIRGAKEEVLIQTFSWEPNSPGVQEHIIPAIQALQAEAKRHPDSFSLPLKIRILVNQARGPAAKFMKRKKGNRAPTIENLLPNLGNIDKNLLNIKGGVHVNKLTDGLHSKTVIADGQRVAITGANVQKRNHATDEGSGLAAYDTGAVLRGEVGLSLRAGFEHNWERSLDAQDKPNKKLRRLSVSPDFDNDSTLTETPITVLTRKANIDPFNRSLANPQAQGFLTAIQNARNRISIQSPNLNNPVLIKALVAAAHRGVKVELLLSKRFNEQRESALGAGGTNAKAVKKLKSLSKNSSNLDIRWYVAPGGNEPVEENRLGDGASHAKFASFDDHMVVIGSSNQDNQSWYYADETSLAIAGRDNTVYVRDRLFQPAFDRSVAAD